MKQGILQSYKSLEIGVLQFDGCHKRVLDKSTGMFFLKKGEMDTA